MIRAAVIGSTGYAGNELVRILTSHPEVELIYLGSKSFEGLEYHKIYGGMYEIEALKCANKSLEEISEEADVVFTATPHGYLSRLDLKNIIKNTRLIDLSADYRIKDAAVYSHWYGIDHESKDLLQEAVYGLCEINRNLIDSSTRLIANPGCYTTASILTLYPMVKEGMIDVDTIIIDAESGVTGAGRSPSVAGLFCEVNESVKAYKIASHRHTPEIEQALSLAAKRDIKLTFTPHLVPMNRGILVTAYASLSECVSKDDIRQVYMDYYGKEKFIRILPEGVFPETRWVRGSNYVDINFETDKRTGRLIMLGAIDNIVKGAAGQAIQNMNIMFGLREDMGLEAVPVGI